jgi:hypothetical protein
MAATGNFHDEIARDWYAKRAGVTYPANATLKDMQHTYWSKVVAPPRTTTITDLEWSWLKTLTGVTSKSYADMWREAVVGAGGVPTNSLVENKIIYYRKAA